ncbi:hypothetical protein BKP35_02035 [Anaerobacillus arseniciselenatis]|uniref:YdbS-like PH domain-containing protein n=1 Tax=Anaerobacillus arseniciselenatis TaxID=85682 RepID=A0A1S2LTZ6_9BACI|nr:PH domain-containing protein [Anaerobacillus arseniciselenatis]OIJ15794.1 hypothetical protein BKP35_02035 [Anaerobacillus arseniciselenatis]
MSKGKRLHPVAIFLLFLSALKELIVPIIAAFIFGRGAASWDFPFTAYFVIGGFLFLFLYGYLKWLTFTYNISDEELKIKQGIFIKKQRFIRKERIYSIDITAGVLQRLFQLVAVKIETAGGGNEPEVLLKAVTKKEALMIREQLLKDKVKVETETVDSDDVAIDNAVQDEQRETKWELSNKELLLTAITSSGVGLAFMAVLALFTQLEGWIPDEFIVDTFGYLFHSSLVLIIVLILIIFLVSWIISIVGTVLKYGQFTIVKKGDELEITRGILERRQLTLSLERITAIRVVESVLRQPFGLVSIYVESAGGGSKDEQLSTVLFPIVLKRNLNESLKQIAPDFVFDQTVESLPRKARVRYVIRKLVPAVVLTGIITYFIPYGYVATLLIPIAILYGNLQFKDGGIGRNKGYLWMSYRTVSKTLVVIPKQRVQAFEARQSIIQQIRSLYTIQTSILYSITGKSFNLVDVSKKQKEDLLSWYSYEETKE